MCVCAKLNFLARCKKRARLIGHDTNKKKTGTAKHRLEAGRGGGGQYLRKGGQYLLADHVRGGQFPLADYVRGDEICGGTESAPTPVVSPQTLVMKKFRASDTQDRNK